MPCRVAAAQAGPGKKPYEKTIEDAESLIRKAAEARAQIVCLPEHWLIEHRERAQEAIERLAGAAKNEQIFVITGANYLQVDGKVRVRSMLIDPDGRRIGWQDKVHLFVSEREIAVRGEQYNLIETVMGRIGIMVCYDNVFPEAARGLAMRGADMLFVPSRISSEGLDPWLLYLKTRALENRIPIIAPNIFAPPRFPGGSVIIDLKQNTYTNPIVLPDIVASAGSGRKVIVANINVEQARKLRAERLSERMPQAYGQGD